MDKERPFPQVQGLHGGGCEAVRGEDEEEEEMGRGKSQEAETIIEVMPVFPMNVYDTAGAIVVGDIRFEREVECTMRLEHAGYPCSCWECSACGKKHDAPRLNSYCPRCGARIVQVVE